MIGFLILLMVAGILSATFGLVSGLWALPQIATAPSIEVMPKLIGAFLAVMLGLLLAAVAGGLASLFDKHTQAFDAIEPDLTIQGLSLLHSMVASASR